MWVRELTTRQGARVPVVLVGNKCDMEDQREVNVTEGSTFASQR